MKKKNNSDSIILGVVFVLIVLLFGSIFVKGARDNQSRQVRTTSVSRTATASASNLLSTATTEPASILATQGSYINRASNLRAGPSTSYRILGIATQNQQVEVIGCNVTCDWYQLADGKWVAAHLVTGASKSLPVVGSMVTPSAATESKSTPDTIATIRQRATSVGAPTAQPTLASKQSATNRDANLRAGPGTEYNVVGLARKGQAVTVVGCAKSCSWYMLSDSKWIAAYLVDNATGSYVSVSPPPLPKEPPLPTTALVAPAPQATATPVPQATATPAPTVAPQACVIKGNISYNTGEKIYHVPGQAYYEATVINESYGERWFCSEQEAQAAGWRKAKQ